MSPLDTSNNEIYIDTGFNDAGNTEYTRFKAQCPNSKEPAIRDPLCSYFDSCELPIFRSQAPGEIEVYQELLVSTDNALKCLSGIRYTFTKPGLEPKLFTPPRDWTSFLESARRKPKS